MLRVGDEQQRLPARSGSRHSLSALAAASDIAEQIVRVEANFLRLPLFTLDNKHMRTMDGLRCEGTFRRAGKAYQFSYTVTRNTATYYPGPLARSAHFALLSLATDRGLPLLNPIVFSWRELCSRMGIQASGQIVRSLREALTATKGLMIESRAALFSKSAEAPLDGEEQARIVGLYDQVEFHGGIRDDGSRIDANGVWLSDWYLDNLNRLYSAPLDFVLWRQLNAKSLIASRLYEFLFFKFHGGHDLLRFNYPTLVKFIPVRTERYLSQAKKQLQPAFDLLTACGLLARVQWVESRGGLPQIILHRGLLLNPADERGAEAFDVADDDFTLSRIEDIPLPEWRIVSAFHEAWGNTAFRPGKAELALARNLIATHGEAAVQALLPKLVKRLKTKWADAKTFCAVLRYLPEVLGEIDRDRHRAQLAEQADRAQDEARQEAARKAQHRAALMTVWQGLSDGDRAEIRRHVLASQPKSIENYPNLVERFCLEELSRRHGFA